MERSQAKLIVIGLDGATFDVIRPLARMGKLPHLARLMSEGAHGTLKSIIPPVTGPAWPVLATGKNSGQLGTYDFVNRRSLDDLRLYPISSRDFAGQTFWDILEAKWTIGILNYPMLVPAYPVNGWMVSGLGASRLQNYTYPSELKEELDQVTGGYEITVMYGLPKYRQNLPQLVEDMKELLKRRVAALEHLMSTRPVEALVTVFTVSDIASHTMWHYWDPSDPKHSQDLQDEVMREEFIAIWQALDSAVGRTLEYLAPDGHLLILSDHGFGPSYGVFNVNHWLQQEGYLVRKSNSVGKAGNQIREWLVNQASPFLTPLLKKMVGSKAHQMLRASVLREIDLSTTKALALENSDTCGMIYVNREYARLHGLNEEEFVLRTRTQLKQELRAFGERQKLDIQAFTSDELYRGEKAELAPDILFVVDNFRCSVSYHFEEPVYAERFHHPLKFGMHRLDGILIATGPQIMAGHYDTAQLQDIAPTLLHLADMPVPSSMDGRVLAEILKPECRPSEADAQEPSEVLPAKKIELESKDEDFETVLQRLRDLGYLE